MRDRHHRTACFVAVVAVAVLYAAFSPRSVNAQVPAPAPAVGSLGGVNSVGDLQLQLNAGLKARRDVEFKYIETVVNMVRANKIPLSLVKSTFIWARKKYTHQYQYFVRGLVYRGEQMGYQIPYPAVFP